MKLRFLQNKTLLPLVSILLTMCPFGAKGSSVALLLSTPTNFTATALSANQIQLTWTDNSEEDYFELQRSDDGGVTYTVTKRIAANATSYINGGLRASTKYYFRICAVTGTEKSAYSDVANATTGAIPPVVINNQKVSSLSQKIIYKTSNPNVASITSNADQLLYGYTEEQWLAIVPTQGPRSYFASPITGNNSWTWDSKKPNEVKDDKGNIFPTNNPPTKYVSVKVLSGKTVNIPVWGTDQRQIMGQVNWKKTQFLSDKLPILASAYEVTGNEKYAHRVAITLDSLAKCVPDYYMSKGWNVGTILSPEAAKASGYNVERTSDHNGAAHEVDYDIVYAYDRIKMNDTMAVVSARTGYDVKNNIETNYFKNIVYFLKDTVPSKIHLSTNIPGHLQGIGMIACALHHTDVPEWLYHLADTAVNRNMMRDGICPESLSYGYNYTDDNKRIIDEVSRYIGLYPNDVSIQPFKSDIQRLNNFYTWAMKQHVVMGYPNGLLAPFNNTFNDIYNSAKRTISRSAVLPSYGHVMHAYGSNNNQVQLHAHFAGGANHVQGHGNSIALYAFGNEVMGNIRYDRDRGRQWYESTLSYNTVVVNLVDQDANGNWAVDNAGTHFTNGVLSLYEPNNNGLSISETDNRSRYINVSGVNRYQRLLALNTIDSLHPYVLDLFKVKGGKVHDYVMHGSTWFDQTATASFPLTAMSDTLHPLLNPGSTWKEPTDLNSDNDWYGIFRKVSKGKTPGYWDVTVKKNTSPNVGYRLFMTDNAKNTFYLGKTPAPTRPSGVGDFYQYWRPSMIVRRADSTRNDLESFFVGVIEPINGSSIIDSIRRIPLKTDNPEHIALAVFIKGGRKDVWLVNMNNPKLTDNADAGTLITKDSLFSLDGRIGFFSNTGKNLLVAGKSMRFKDKTISQDSDGYRGSVTGVSRIVEGGTTDAFITDAVLPLGDALKDRWLALYFGVYNNVPSGSGSYAYNVRQQKGMNQMYRIKNVEYKNGKTYINLYEDHCLRMTNGNLEEIMRQHKKFTGPNDFVIYRTAFDNTVLDLQFPNITAMPKLSGSDLTLTCSPSVISESSLISYSLKNTALTQLKVYNMLGEEVKTLVNASQTPGKYSSVLEADALPNGVYIVKLISGASQATCKIIVKK